MTDARENLLQNFLRKIAEELKYDDPDIDTTVLPTTGANFTSQLFYATIKSKDKENLNVFAKVLVIGETMREQVGCSSELLEIEPTFYGKTAKAYKELEETHKVPEEHRLMVPKFYGCSQEYLKELLVLEDMSKKGYVMWNRLKSVDWDYASKAIEELAKFHALSIAYQVAYPEDYEESKKIFRKVAFGDISSMQDMMKQTIAQVVKMTREENKDKVHEFYTANFTADNFMKYYNPKKRPVLNHGDYKHSNLLHKIDDEGKYQLVIVDYQTLLPGSAATDLLYFIFLGSDAAFRAQYYDQLIEHYYENLAAALRRLHLDPEEVFPRAVFDEELKESLPFGLLISGMTLPFITMDLDNVTNEKGEYENVSIEGLTNMMSKTNDLCAARLNEVIDDYIKWGLL